MGMCTQQNGVWAGLHQTNCTNIKAHVVLEYVAPDNRGGQILGIPISSAIAMNWLTIWVGVVNADGMGILQYHYHNPLMLTVAKSSLTILVKYYRQKHSWKKDFKEKC